MYVRSTKNYFPPEQKKTKTTPQLYGKYVRTKNYFPPEAQKLTQHHNCMVL
jgi:hypothetical protein